jgi:hypothetical protein
VSQLKSRIYIGDQYVVRKGEMFHKIFMIDKGQVALSLKNRKENEFFILYKGNYFGDY